MAFNLKQLEEDFQKQVIKAGSAGVSLISARYGCSRRLYPLSNAGTG
jgi:hypothetical protein